jgi:hypothetical protein
VTALSGERCKSTTVRGLIGSVGEHRVALPYFAHIGATRDFDKGSELLRASAATAIGAVHPVSRLERA